MVNTKYTFNSVTMYTESNINHQKYEMTDLHKVSTFEGILDQVILRDCNESYLRQIKYSFDQFRGLHLSTHVNYPDFIIDLPELQL